MAGRSPEARNTAGGTDRRTSERANMGKDGNYPEKLPQRSKYKRLSGRRREELKQIRDRFDLTQNENFKELLILRDQLEMP